MKVLDATFLIDYLDGVEATKRYLTTHGEERFILPVPAYAEALVGEGNGPDESDIEGTRNDFAWAEVYAVDERTAVTAAEIADEMGPQGPFLSGMDALVAAIGRELDAPIVSRDGDLTRREAKRIITVEEYRPPRVN